jgi:hypothetical protein
MVARPLLSARYPAGQITAHIIRAQLNYVIQIPVNFYLSIIIWNKLRT